MHYTEDTRLSHVHGDPLSMVDPYVSLALGRAGLIENKKCRIIFLYYLFLFPFFMNLYLNRSLLDHAFNV
jgi:hypothetical protein